MNEKAINKLPFRKITIGQKTYYWKRGHYHLAEFTHSRCVEKVVIYEEGFKNIPLKIYFKEEDNILFKSDVTKEQWCVGYPDDGVIWLFKPREDLKPQTADSLETNLNRPAVIRALIEYFHTQGWQPATSKQPYIVEDGLRYMEIIDLPRGIL